MKILCWLWLLQLPSSAPVYTEGSVVNAASQTVDRFAPNTILTLYGTNLTFGTAANPNVNGSGVVMLRGISPIDILFVSPRQINFLMPAETREGTYLLRLAREGVSGPQIQIQVRAQAAELFATPENWLLATHANGSLVTAEDPARPGEMIVFYGTGFGPIVSGLPNQKPDIDWLEFASEFVVLVNGEPMPGIYFAGRAPAYKGLFQVNYTLPAGRIAEPNPQIRVSARGDRSREGTRLWFKP